MPILMVSPPPAAHAEAKKAVTSKTETIVTTNLIFIFSSFSNYKSFHKEIVIRLLPSIRIRQKVKKTYSHHLQF